MENNQLFIYNTLTRKKELFVPLHAPHVGMYVCGPTVYGDGHLGHARPAITFDIVFRYLTHLGYKVRYVRNITDVGHLEHDADDGEDKIAKKARLEQLEPMEVVQYYLLRYHKAMEALNVLPPSIEPHASGHIIEQIKLVEEILKNGYAYESKGSVYFDVAKYNKDHHYGVLSGRNLDDVLNTTRELDGQDEKHNPADFALWKCAQPEHIMRWPSPWSNGFPGWHCECTAMGRKYLGETFDIHGGGMDLVFPHHECEIAQAVASEGHQMVRYWMHNNMITINGQKMGKSLGNFITLDEFFTGSNKLLTQAYSPMTIRFFILQAHYRSTVDFSNEALQAAEKGLERLLEGVKNLDRITPAKATSGIEPKGLREKCYEAMNDDLNTPIVISHLFDATRMINTVIDKKATISAEDLEELKSVFHLFVFDILGLKAEAENNAAREEAYGKVVDMLLEQRMQAKANKDWATSDKIRDNLAALGFEVDNHCFVVSLFAQSHLLFEAFQLVNRVVQFRVCVAQLFTVHHQLKAFCQIRIAAVFLCQRRHFDRIVSDESRLNVVAFAEFAEDFVNQLAFTHGVVNFHVEFLANFTNLLFVHTSQVIAREFLDRIQHGYTFERSFEVDYVVAYLYFCCTVYIQTDFFNHVFCKLHHPVVILVSYVDFHTGKFRIVCTVHTFVTEVLTDFIHTFETTHNQSLQVQLTGNTHVQWNIQCVVVSDKRTCRSTSGNRLKNRSFNFDISFRVEILSHRVVDLVPFQEDFFNSVVYYQVYIALTVTEFRVFKFIVSHSIFVFYNRERTD